MKGPQKRKLFWRFLRNLNSKKTNFNPNKAGIFRFVIIFSVLLLGCFLGGIGKAQAGSVTQANMKMSIVNGTAFVDFNVASVLTSNIGAQLTITDHAGKNLVGYIKAAGTGETYGTENLPNTAFSNTTSVGPGSNSAVTSVVGGQSGNALQVAGTGGNSNPYASEAMTLISGGLYKFSSYFLKGTNDEGSIYLQENSGAYTIYRRLYSSATSWTNISVYDTTTMTTMLAGFGSDWSVANGTTLFDTASVTQVLTPSTTGVTITSIANGSTYNWASEDSGFNRNDSGGYTYTISGVIIAPTFDNGTGTYNNATSVTISDSTNGVTICYTTDGTDPTATTPGTCSNGSTYSTPVSITTTATTLKAIATKATMTNSGIASAIYTLTNATPTASPPAGTILPNTNVALSTVTTGGTIYYTTDNSTPACPATGTLYSGPITVASSETINLNSSDILYTSRIS